MAQVCAPSPRQSWPPAACLLLQCRWRSCRPSHSANCAVLRPAERSVCAFHHPVSARTRLTRRRSPRISRAGRHYLPAGPPAWAAFSRWNAAYDRREQPGYDPSAAPVDRSPPAGGPPFPSSCRFLLPNPLLENRGCVLLIELNDLLQTPLRSVLYFSGYVLHEVRRVLVRMLGRRTTLAAHQADALLQLELRALGRPGAVEDRVHRRPQAEPDKHDCYGKDGGGTDEAAGLAHQHLHEGDRRDRRKVARTFRELYRRDLDLIPSRAVKARGRGGKLGNLGDLGLYRRFTDLVSKTGHKARPIDQNRKKQLIYDVTVAYSGR